MKHRDYDRNYHMGLLRDYKHPKTIIVQMRENIDFLDCELWQYLGVKRTTKRWIRLQKNDILQKINREYMQYFDRIIID